MICRSLRSVVACFVFLNAGQLWACQQQSDSRSFEVRARPQSVSEVEVLRCRTAGFNAISLSGEVSSSLVRSRAYLSIRFFGPTGKVLWTFKGRPLLGQFNGLSVNEVIPVPVGAMEFSVAVVAESGQPDATGIASIRSIAVERGIVAELQPEGSHVAGAGEPTAWSVKSASGSPEIQVEFVARSIEGEVVHLYRDTLPSGGGRLLIQTGTFSPGYYAISANLTSDGHAPRSVRSALAVFSEAMPPQVDSRLGVDAALSWYGGDDDDLQRAARMMRHAGLGSLRDRLSWSRVNSKSGRFEWGRYQTVARIFHDAGFELTTAFHDAPAWTRGGDKHGASPDRKPPLDSEAAYAFGSAFARDMGPYVRVVEYWNEQNSNFFAGYPYQYANGLKAFAAGVRDADSSMAVLLGAAAGQPGRFFQEIYKNNAAAFIDGRNQHYYGQPEALAKFLDTHARPAEISAGADTLPSWLTEIGMSLRPDSSGSFTDAESAQASYLVKAYVEGLATGHERVFFFFLRELLEADFHTWGILRQDFSPLPAYVALGAFARHVAGAELVAVSRRGGSTVAYFRASQEGRLKAVAWGTGAIQSIVGRHGAVKDIYGRGVERTQLSGVPLLIEGVDQLAGSVATASRSLVARMRPSLRMNVDVHVAGRSVGLPDENRIAIDVADRQEIVLRGTIFSTNETVPNVRCLGSSGVTAKSDFSLAHVSSEKDRFGYECRYTAALSKVGEGSASVQVNAGVEVDRVHVALRTNASTLAGAERSLAGLGMCASWLPRASSNVSLKIDSSQTTATACPSGMFRSEVRRDGETWVFPASPLKSGLDGYVGAIFDVGHLEGAAFPPRPMLLQLVEQGGGIWLVELTRRTEGGHDTYTGLFSLAKQAPWRPDPDGKLDLSKVKEWMFGWGGYGGQKGQVHGFVVRSIDLIADPATH